jgi:hypothetical protein
MSGPRPDFRRRGRPIGIEIPTPNSLLLATLDRVSCDLGLPTAAVRRRLALCGQDILTAKEPRSDIFQPFS